MKPPANLAKLRQAIDGIDDRIHDLIVKRTAIVESIAQVKKETGGPVFRPGREASVLTRLLARHTGPLPPETLVRIWRELMGGLVKVQAPDFTVALLAGGRSRIGYDLARDHFGAAIDLEPLPSAKRVIGAVAAGQAALGLLPPAVENEPEPWWPILMEEAQAGLHIVARLPILAGHEREPTALVVAAAPSEPSGDDLFLLGLETESEISRAALKADLAKAGLVAQPVAVVAGKGHHLALVQGEGALAADDERLARLSALYRRRRVLGFFARPLAPTPSKTTTATKTSQRTDRRGAR